MLNLNELLSEVIEPLGASEVEPIYSYVDEVRRGAIRAITEKFPEALRPEAKQVVPIKFLESRTYEGVLAASSWLTELILEGKVDSQVIESVYAALYMEYIHLSAGEEEENKTDALDVRERMGKIIAILKQKKFAEKSAETNIFIDILAARFEFDFYENFEQSQAILEPMEAHGYEGCVVLLGSVYEAAGEYSKAKTLYTNWAEKSRNPLYYRLLVRVLWKLSEFEAANQWYEDYVTLTEGTKEDPTPFVVLKESIDTDDDLSELGVVITDLFSRKSFDSAYVSLLSKAREYVDGGLRETLSELNTLALAISEGEADFSLEYANSHRYQVESKSLFAPEYHHIWIRMLFLYAINAVVLFDNTPIRQFEIFSKDGDIVQSKKLKELGAKIAQEQTEIDGSEASERKPLQNFGKVEEFLDFISEMGSSEEGALILTEFFARYPFRSISRLVDGLEEKYEKSAKGKSNVASTSSGEQENEDTEDTLIPFSSQLKYSDLTIGFNYGAIDDGDEGEDDDSSAKEDDEESYVGALPGKVETPKTIPLEDMLFFINSVYIAPEDRAIQERACALQEKQNEDIGTPIEKSGFELARIDTLEKGLSMAGDGMHEEYKMVGGIIREKWGPTVEKTLLYYASESVMIADQIPEFVLNDYYLAWYLLVSHLLCADEIDDDLVKNLLEQSVFYIDYLEGVDDLNSMIISCLVFSGLYDLACDFMIRTRMVTSPPTFALFLSCLSYLEDDIQAGFFEEIETEVFPEYEGVSDIAGLITAIEGDIEEGDEFEKDDKIRIRLARAYYYLIENDYEQVRVILAQIDEQIDENIPDMVIAEREFLGVRLHIEDDIENGKTAVLPELEKLYERLDFEYKTECMYYMLRLSFREETELQFKLYLDRALEDKLQIGLWRFSYGLLSRSESQQRESLAALATSDLTFMPKEVEKKLIDKSLTWKYQSEPISEYGDRRLQAAYLLAHLPSGDATILDAIYQYSIWLHHYLRPKNGQYTRGELESLIEIFETSFGYVEMTPLYEQDLDRTFSHFLIKHFHHFSEEFTKVQKLQKQAEPKTPFPEEQYSVWRKTTRNFIEIFQRFRNDELEPFIGDIRAVYRMKSGEGIEEMDTRTVQIQSQLIH